MKKQYTNPIIEIIKLENEDILTASSLSKNSNYDFDENMNVFENW